MQSTCEGCVLSTLNSYGATAACVTLFAKHLWRLCAVLHTVHSYVLKGICMCYAIGRAQLCITDPRNTKLCSVATACVTLYAESTCECCWLGARGKESSQWWGGGAGTGSQFSILIPSILTIPSILSNLNCYPPKYLPISSFLSYHHSHLWWGGGASTGSQFKIE